MTSTNSISSILFISLIITLRSTLGFELLTNICFPTSAAASATQYKTNVKTLLRLLATRRTLAKTGFSTGSTGQPDTRRAYGLINCRSDVSSSNCKACGRLATRAAPFVCPGSQGAVLWYDSCTLKYYDFDFIGTIDTYNQFTFTSSVTSVDPIAFSSRVKGMLTKLSKKAVADNRGLFALGKTKADANTTVYGMVECTRDLSRRDCGICLREVIGEFYSCCSGIKGGRVIAASCMFRFEYYPFL